VLRDGSAASHASIHGPPASSIIPATNARSSAARVSVSRVAAGLAVPELGDLAAERLLAVERIPDRIRKLRAAAEQAFQERHRGHLPGFDRTLSRRAAAR